VFQTFTSWLCFFLLERFWTDALKS
jgi:hypothetical protein